MKKYIALIVALLIAVPITSYFSYKIGYNANTEAKNKNEAQIVYVGDNEANLGIIDYPLIEISFIQNEEDEWLIIDRSDPFVDFGEEVKKEKVNMLHIKDYEEARALNHSKGALKVVTFPTGLGTTPEGVIYVYKNEVLIKEVPYLKIEFGNKELFRQVPIKEAEKLIGESLPSPI